MQDIQATGLVNIQQVTSHNNPADIYTKCVTSPVLERHLRHNGIIELHIEEGKINYFHVLELAEQSEQYFSVTSDEDVEYTKVQQQRLKNGEYTRERRLRVQQKINKQMKQLFNNKQRKKNNKKLYLENKRCEAVHQADLAHKQSQLLLQHQDRAHHAHQAHLDHVMEEYRNDFGEDYIPFINMIDINSNEQLPRHRPRPEQQRQTALPRESGRTTTDIMADILLRKQQQLQPRSSSSHLGGDEGEGGEETSGRRVRSPSPVSTSATVEQSSQASETSMVTTTRRRHRPRTSIIVTTLFSLFYFMSVFTSKIEIQLPSYIISASESVHQLRGSSEAWSYLEYIEELAHPTVYFLEYVVSRAASDIGDVSGVPEGRPQPPSPPTSVYPLISAIVMGAQSCELMTITSRGTPTSITGYGAPPKSKGDFTVRL